MIRSVIVDTGPLVAILRESDEHHSFCAAALHHAAKPLLTCWPVVTKAAWLLRNQSEGILNLFRLLQSGAIKIIELDEHAVPWMGEFLARYSSIRAQVADAAVMYLAERPETGAVFTLDRRDFSTYRLSNGKAVPLLQGP